jgi:hypothetical protein
MEFIPVLNDFFEIATNDRRLGITHLCIYIALFQCWNKNHFQNPITIRRIQVMRLAKINAKTTYHKCIKELELAGYINYRPSYNPKGSEVYMLDPAKSISE